MACTACLVVSLVLLVAAAKKEEEKANNVALTNLKQSFDIYEPKFKSK
jgi:hypothetical protein